MKGCNGNEMANVTMTSKDGNRRFMIVCEDGKPCGGHSDCRKCPKCKKYWSVNN